MMECAKKQWLREEAEVAGGTFQTVRLHCHVGARLRRATFRAEVGSRAMNTRLPIREHQENSEILYT